MQISAIMKPMMFSYKGRLLISLRIEISPDNGPEQVSDESHEIFICGCTCNKNSSYLLWMDEEDTSSVATSYAG